MKSFWTFALGFIAYAVISFALHLVLWDNTHVLDIILGGTIAGLLLIEKRNRS